MSLSNTYSEIYSVLKNAGKKGGGNAAFYTRVINRGLARRLSPLLIMLKLSPNQVSIVSFLFTTAGLVLLLVEQSVLTCLLAALLLVVGYVFDSCDGQIARYSNKSSIQGDWLDHVLDTAKISAVMLILSTLAIRKCPFEGLLFIIFVYSSVVVSSMLFFSSMYTLKTEIYKTMFLANKPDGMPMKNTYVIDILKNLNDYGFIILLVALSFSQYFFFIFSVWLLFLYGYSFSLLYRTYSRLGVIDNR